MDVKVCLWMRRYEHGCRAYVNEGMSKEYVRGKDQEGMSRGMTMDEN